MPGRTLSEYLDEEHDQLIVDYGREQAFTRKERHKPGAEHDRPFFFEMYSRWYEYYDRQSAHRGDVAGFPTPAAWKQAIRGAGPLKGENDVLEELIEDLSRSIGDPAVDRHLRALRRLLYIERESNACILDRPVR